MKLTELIDADMFRDGGSYSATFSTDDGAPYGLWLQTWPIEKKRGLYHRWLFEFRGESRPQGCPPVSTGSAQETELVRRVDDFLKSPVVRANPDDSGASEMALARLRQLREYLVLRARSLVATGCHVANGLGDTRDEPSDVEMWRFLREVDRADREHGAVWLVSATGAALEWNGDGRLVYSRPGEPAPRHMEKVQREAALELWIALAEGRGAEVDSAAWCPGDGRASSLAEQTAIQAPQLHADREFYDSLGDERPETRCRKAQCTRGAIAFSVLCRQHHFASVRGAPCPFDH